MSRLLSRVMRNPAVHRVLGWSIAQYMRFVFHTTRWSHERIPDAVEHLRAGRRVVIVLWHNRVAMMPFGWRWPEHPLTALISDHRDGRLLAEALSAAGVGHIRVPANQMGMRDNAEDLMLKLDTARSIRAAMNAGSTIGVVGDGPRGPRFRLKPAVLLLARMTNAEITLVTYSVRRRIVASSWDRLIIPLPFNRGTLRWSERFYDPRACDADRLDAMREEIERELTALTDDADRTMGHAPIT